MVNDEHPKKIVENLFSTMYYIEKKKIMFHHFSSSDWSSLLVLSSADQRGSALGTAYILAHSMLLQKIALVSGGTTYSESLAKLET